MRGKLHSVAVLKSELGLAELFIIRLIAFEVGSHLAIENLISLINEVISHWVLESDGAIIHIVVSYLFVLYHIPNSDGIFSLRLGDSNRD